MKLLALIFALINLVTLTTAVHGGAFPNAIISGGLFIYFMYKALD